MTDVRLVRSPGLRVRRVVSHARFETVSVLRNGEQLLLALVLPLGLLVFLTTTPLLDALGAVGPGGDRLSIALPGTLGLCLASTAFTGQAIATAFDRRYGVLAQLATTPLGTSGLILGKLGAVIGVVVLQFGLAFAIACAFGFAGPVAPLALTLTTVLGTASLLSLGLLMAGTLRPEATLGAANLVWVLMAGVGGLVLPGSGDWGTVVGFLPSGAIGDAMRMSLSGGWDISAMIVLLVWSLVGALAARRWFRFE